MKEHKAAAHAEMHKHHKEMHKHHMREMKHHEHEMKKHEGKHDGKMKEMNSCKGKK